MITRNNKWLNQRLLCILSMHFSDLYHVDKIQIKFGKKAITRLGSIRQTKEGISLILINAHFKNLNIPAYVVDGVIGHELSHFAHGFQSDLPQKHAHPHLGGVVDKEMKERGMGAILKLKDNWVDSNWREFILKNHSRKVRVRRQKRQKTSFFIWKI